MTLTRRTPLRAKKTLRPKKPCPTVEGLMKSGALSKASSFKAKPKPMKKRRETKGPTQMDVFREIWAEREHVSEVSGLPLGDVLQPIFFSHLLPKGSYRRYKLDKRNIVLITADEHREWHEEGPDNLSRYVEWAPICERYYALRNEANGVNS